MRNSGIILFICAGLLLSGGAILGGSVACNLVRMSHFFWTTDLGVELGCSVFFLSGALLCLPTCWLATIVPYHSKSTSLVATLMALSMATMLTLSVGVSSISSLTRTVREPAALNASMHRALSHVGFDPTVRAAFTTMQLELKCCGVHSPSEWLTYRSSLPSSCCGKPNGKWNEKCDQPALFNVGCLRPALTELRHYANSITILASALIFVMAVTLFSASYTLVSEVLDRAESRFKPQQIRVATLQPPTLPSMLTLATSPITHV